jgi:DNA-entry nuclease
VFTSVDGSSTPDSGNQGGTTVPDDNTGSGSTGSDNEDTYTFVLNTSSKKIHDPSCGSVATMSEKNKKEWTGTYEELQELLSSGYTTCGTCKPAVE